jgi:two-component system, cell cycle response regulator
MSAQDVIRLEEKRDGKLKVLVVDDEVDNLDLLKRVLHKEYDVYAAESGEAALKLMEEHDFFLILTDQRMPKMLGTEFLEESVKRDPSAIRILITGYSDIESVIDAINKGAVHRYIKKPWNREELRREIELSIQIQRLVVENQQLVKTLQETNKRLGEHEVLLRKGLDDRSRQLLDTNEELRKLNQRLEGLTMQDGLTGLYNHRAFQQRLREEVARASRANKPLSLLFFDIDHFKKYNDTNGHPAGDELLKGIAGILTGDSRLNTEKNWGVRASDIVARYGGEEFAVLLPETPLEGAGIKAERIRKSIAGHNFQHMESQPEKRVTVSIGVACFPDDANRAADLVDCADKAMYLAKRTGRDRVCLHKEIK